MLSLGTHALRQRLDSVYYSGTGTLNQLTNQASNSLLTEERRSVVMQLGSHLN